MTAKIKKDLSMTFWVTLSAFIYSIAITSFAEVGGLYPSGFGGVSRIISDLCLRYFDITIPFGVLYFILNIPPTILAFKYIGKYFTIFSILQYVLSSFFTGFMPPLFSLDDPLLIAIFGGLINGVGIGIALRNNASSGGTDFISIFVSSRFNRPAWNYIMAANAIVLAIAGLIFGWEIALYSIVYQFVSTQVIDKLHERYKMVTLNIVTTKPNEVVSNVLKGTRHGITEIKTEGGYLHKQYTMLYMVINRFQQRQVIKAVLEMDPKAFINITQTVQIVGNYYQKPID